MSKLIAQDLIDYEQAVARLKNAKEQELILRLKIVKSFRYKKSEGVEHKSVEGLDIDIAVTLGLTRKIDENGLDAIWDNLSDEQKEVIKSKPSVVVSKFKKLVESDEIGELLNVITEKPSLAKIKLKWDES